MADVSIEKLASLTGTENKAGIETLNASMSFSKRIWKYAMSSCSVTYIFRSNVQFEIDLNWTISLELVIEIKLTKKNLIKTMCM